MIEQMDRSSGAVLGFTVSGDVGRADYDVLTPAVESAVNEFGDVHLVLDLTGFAHEKVDAWGADLHFGHEFRHKIAKLAIVGDHRWEKYLAKLSSPLYARESAFFADVDAAWAWLQS